MGPNQECENLYDTGDAGGEIARLAALRSTLSLIAYPANFLIPITRCLGIHLDAARAVNLTRNRRQDQVQQAAPAA